MPYDDIIDTCFGNNKVKRLVILRLIEQLGQNIIGKILAGIRIIRRSDYPVMGGGSEKSTTEPKYKTTKPIIRTMVFLTLRFSRSRFIS